MIIWMQVATFIFMPIFALTSDYADVRIIIPLAFFARGSIAITFTAVQDPSSVLAYSLTVMLTLTSIVVFLNVSVLFMRNMNPTIRGILVSLAFFFGQLGATVFHFVGGYLFD